MSFDVLWARICINRTTRLYGLPEAFGAQAMQALALMAETIQMSPDDIAIIVDDMSTRAGELRRRQTEIDAMWDQINQVCEASYAGV